MADVASLERALTPRLLRDSQQEITSAPVVMLDGNLSGESLQVGHRAACASLSDIIFASTKSRHDLDCINPLLTYLSERVSIIYTATRVRQTFIAFCRAGGM